MTSKGRALQPVRPGHTIKSVLMGQIPIDDGRYVNEASITDLHHVYKRLIEGENSRRDRIHRLRGMSIYSFTTVFKFARYLGLVECIGTEDNPSPIRPAKIYRLTQKGMEDGISWNNLPKAWKDQHLAAVEAV